MHPPTRTSAATVRIGSAEPRSPMPKAPTTPKPNREQSCVAVRLHAENEALASRSAAIVDAAVKLRALGIVRRTIDSTRGLQP